MISGHDYYDGVIIEFTQNILQTGLELLYFISPQDVTMLLHTCAGSAVDIYA